MISSTLIRGKYIDLYTELRRYIWPYDKVELIADLELAANIAIPDIAEVKVALGKLRNACAEERAKDAELQSAFDKFDNLISEESEPYLQLNQVNEVIS